MTSLEVLDRIAITVRSHRLLKQLLEENPKLESIMRQSRNEIEALGGVRNWVMSVVETRPAALAFYRAEHPSNGQFEALGWSDLAAIRLLDYLDNAGRAFPDLNLQGEIAVSDPVRLIWMAVTHGTGGAKPAFFEDMLQLFRQFTGASERRVPSPSDVEGWMHRFPSGLDPRLIRLREENRDRILRVIIRRIDAGEIRSSKYQFKPGMSAGQKHLRALEWWNQSAFHLTFAVRNPDLLNEMLGFSLDPDTMKILYRARDKGIPF
ncbi:MAG: hypothetical protein GY953_19385, partial [bacterium]|nr:hypothetical protein [bacterium]